MSACYRFSLIDLALLTWASSVYPHITAKIINAENAATDAIAKREQADEYIAQALAWLNERREWWETAGDVAFAFERFTKSSAGATERTVSDFPTSLIRTDEKSFASVAPIGNQTTPDMAGDGHAVHVVRKKKKHASGSPRKGDGRAEVSPGLWTLPASGVERDSGLPAMCDGEETQVALHG